MGSFRTYALFQKSHLLRRFSTSRTMSRNYGDAIAALNSLQTNSAAIQRFNKTHSRNDINKTSISEMVEWIRRIGYQRSDLNSLNTVHVAGTKGKGSTSSFITSILSQYASGPSPKVNRVGLYTSPHLRFARERIGIDNAPLSEEKFARYFFEVWDRLEKAATAAGEDPKGPRAKPQYFRYLTLMAFHTYLSEGVDAAVIECGIGGEYDCTNVLERPAASAIASLGIDHTALLGDTIEQIAWHKGGVIKPGVKAFSVSQAASAEKVLQKRAEEKATQISIVSRHPDLESTDIKLGLAGDFQYTNATLAVATAAEYLRKVGVEGIPEDIMSQPLPVEFRRGLELARLGGRCETRHEKNVTWYIDGGHTMESIKVAGEWFVSQIKENSVSTETADRKLRLLIFNQQNRDSNALARALHSTLSAALGADMPFTHAIFCTNITYKESGYRPDLVSMNTSATDIERLRVQKSLAETWKEIDPRTEVKVYSTIEEAVDYARELAAKGQGIVADEAPLMTFVTGSLHLVGGFLDVIETKPGPQ